MSPYIVQSHIRAAPCIETDTIIFREAISAGENSWKRDRAVKQFCVVASGPIANTTICRAAISASEQKYWWEKFEQRFCLTEGPTSPTAGFGAL